jgi:peptide/nickel transport system ATP-binding protein
LASIPSNNLLTGASPSGTCGFNYLLAAVLIIFLLPLIQIKNLTVDFPGTESDSPALQDVGLELNRGEMLAVVGESGSGKSVMSLTLMNLLSKAARVVKGSVLFSPDGKQVTDLLQVPEKNFRAFRGNQLAMIFQEPMTSLNPVMTCGAQLSEPLMQHKKMSRRQARNESLRLFGKVQLPDPEIVYNKYPHQLSGGQKQRVMIAMAISCNPAVLICDEPTTALDVRVQKTILDLLKGLRQSENMGMIFITHDLGLVADMADRALVMLRGRVVESGKVNEIFSNPQHPYTRGLLMCRPALHVKGERLPVVSDFLENKQSSDHLSSLKSFTSPAFNRVSEDFKSKNIPETEPEILLEVKGLHLRYSSGKSWLGREKRWVDAIQDINFKVYRGETLGLVGESGSGKTTLGHALLGLNKPVRGSISYAGTELLEMGKAALLAFRRNIQIVFQDPYSSLNPRLMIGPAIAEPLKVHDSLGRTERKMMVLELLQKVDLKPEHYNRYPHAFSGGQRQRIVIARALALHPGFVVFDESVSALDVSVQAQVLNLINDLKDKLGFTAVFISHDLSVIRYLCDRVIVMEKGRIVESGDAESVYRNPQNAYTRSLIEAIPGNNPG